MDAKLRDWLSPVVYLSRNWLSRAGVFLVTTSTVLWIYLLPTIWRGDVEHPYFGILTYLILPAGFFGGLALIPLGIALRRRLEHRKGTYPANFGPLRLGTLELRRLLYFIGATTVLNVLIGGHLTYNAVSYMDGTAFCGTTCHTVMAPEYAAYQNSPHARVECVKCHIGPGASWFVRSKLSGVPQVLAVSFHNYPKPIPTPVHNLRPARETCEVCHWPQKFEGDQLRIIQKYGDDEKNTHTQTVLLLHIGGGSGGPGIHSAHLGPGVTIRYGPDESRQKVFWVLYENTVTHRRTIYSGEDTKPQSVNENAGRVMDCVDCHNRPTHAFELPERAVDRALAAGDISPSLPFIKKESVELLKQSYKEQSEAQARIPASLGDFYHQHYPAVALERAAEIVAAARILVSIYRRNVFPDMKVGWGTYPNNLGHTDFPGCFRCHDNGHTSGDGKTIPQDCGTCHNLLAADDPNPRILTDLGIAAPQGANQPGSLR
jgi:hypothetical protein